MALTKKSLLSHARVVAGLLMGFSGLVLLLIAVIMAFEVLWIPIAGAALLITGLLLAGPKRLIKLLLSLPPA